MSPPKIPWPVAPISKAMRSAKVIQKERSPFSAGLLDPRGGHEYATMSAMKPSYVAVRQGKHLNKIWRISGLLRWTGYTQQSYERIRSKLYPCIKKNSTQQEFMSYIRVESQHRRLLVSMLQCQKDDPQCRWAKRKSDHLKKGQLVIHKRNQQLFFSMALSKSQQHITGLYIGNESDSHTELMVRFADGSGVVFDQDVARCSKEKPKPAQPNPTLPNSGSPARANVTQ